MFICLKGEQEHELEQKGKRKKIGCASGASKQEKHTLNTLAYTLRERMAAWQHGSNQLQSSSIVLQNALKLSFANTFS